MCAGRIATVGLVLGFAWAASAAASPAYLQDSAARARAAADSPPEGLPAVDWAGICAAYDAGRHAASEVDGGFRAYNPGQQWAARFDGRGFTVEPDAGGWSWGLALERWGFAGQEHSVVPRAADVHAEGERVAYEWDADLTEWYVNDARGLEHGYTVHQRPPGAETSGNLTFSLAVRGNLRAEVNTDGRGVRFVDGTNAGVVTYAGLLVLDADGRELEAGFEVTEGGLCLSIDERGARYPLTIDPLAQQAYLKASNTDALDHFGHSVAVSGDTVVVGAPHEDSNATGVDGDPSNNDSDAAGAAYVFVRNGDTWIQQAYLKASNTEPSGGSPGDEFGCAVALSGETVVVGAFGEDSAAWGVNNDQGNNGLQDSGAAYVFVRDGTTWSQQAYVKAPEGAYRLGETVAISGDRLVVGGLANRFHIYVRNGTQWSVEASITEFGAGHCSLSGDTLVIGCPFEGNGGAGSGAADVYVRNGSSWPQTVSLKAPTPQPQDHFGEAIAVSGDTIVVGAPDEDSKAAGVNGDESDDSLSGAGAAYVFVRSGTTWSQQAYLKASNPGTNDAFGSSVAITGDTIVIGALGEDSSGIGVDGIVDNAAPSSGAAYVFGRKGTTWVQQAYLKASNTTAQDRFGSCVAASDDTIVVGARAEGSSALGVNGEQESELSPESGAAYVFAITPPLVGAYCQGKPNSQGCVPTMDWSGSPSASAASPFLVTCSKVLNQKSGLLFFGSAAAAIPFQGATLCVLPPLHRTALQNSMGSPPPQENCTGKYAFDMNALIQGGLDPSLTAGEVIHAQYWGRDPAAPFGTSLSNAVLFEIGP